VQCTSTLADERSLPSMRLVNLWLAGSTTEVKRSRKRDRTS
jgi:hypothetical protein